MESVDFISGLLARDMDLALQIIFLELDPVSLKNCRLVCQQWSSFIKRRIHPKLRQLLLFQWKNATPTPKYLHFDEAIRSLSCDESILVCGMSNGVAKVYNFVTLDHITDLDCNQVKSLLSRITFRSHKGHVHTAIGKDIVAAVTSKGVVSVWKIEDWSNLFKKAIHSLQDEPGWPHWRLPVIKVLPRMILVLTSNVPRTAEADEIKENWNLDILSWDGSNAVLLTSIAEDASLYFQTLDYLKPKTLVYLFDADDDYILVARGNTISAVNLELWSQLSNTMVAKAAIDLSSDESYVHNLIINTVLLAYPFAIVGAHGTSAPGNSCIISMNLLTGEDGSRADFHTSRFDIHRNGFKLIASPQRDYERNVVMYNLEDFKTQVDQLDISKRGQKIAGPENPDPASEYLIMNSCINTAGVAVATGFDLHVWDFWYCNVYDGEDSWKHGRGLPRYEPYGGCRPGGPTE